MKAMDFRDAAFSTVRELMLQDKKTVVLYNDMGAMGLDTIRSDFPGRVINAGICEQNMASVAAGLALTGRQVFLYGIIAHIFARGFEQIRNDICCTSLPVVILGVGSGLSYGSDGPTHHGVQDIAVMRTLPKMMVCNPADGVCACALIRLAAERRGPAYVRLDKEQLPPFYKEDTDFRKGFSVLSEGRDVALIATGILVHRAIKASQKLIEEGIGVRVIDLYRLKPVDTSALAEAVLGVRAVVTIEENTPVGGLGSMIAELLAHSSTHPKFHSICLQDDPLMSACSRSWAEQRFGLTLEHVTATVRRAAAFG